MYAVIRRYTGAPEIFNQLEQNQAEVTRSTRDRLRLKRSPPDVQPVA